VVPRNAARSPWIHTVDLRVTQMIPLGWRDATAEVYVNVVNFGNLLDEDWGRLDEVQSYRRAVAGATYDPAARDGLGQYNYIFNSGTLDGIPTVANDTPASRWQVQAGMCVRF